MRPRRCPRWFSESLLQRVEARVLLSGEGPAAAGMPPVDLLDGVAAASAALVPGGVGAAAPSAPVGLRLMAMSHNQVKLTWQDTSSDESEFVIERSRSASFAMVTRLIAPANATSYTDSLLESQATYYYRIRARGMGLDSEATPAGVVGLLPVGWRTAVIGSDTLGNVSFDWSTQRVNLSSTGVATSTSSNGVYVYQQGTPDGMWKASDVRIDENSRAGFSIRSSLAGDANQLTARVNPVSSTLQLRGSTLGASATRTMFGLPYIEGTLELRAGKRGTSLLNMGTPDGTTWSANGGPYTYGGVDSQWYVGFLLSMYSATTAPETFASFDMIEYSPPPQPPTSFRADAVGPNAVVLTWNSGDVSTTQYAYQTSTNGTTWTNAVHVAASRAVLTGLSAATTYYFRLAALNDVSPQAGTGYSSYVTLATTTLPAETGLGNVYAFNESAGASVYSGVGNSISTLMGGATRVAGHFDGGIAFDGTTGYVNLTGSTSLRGTGSLAFWINTTQTGNASAGLAPGVTGVDAAGTTDDIFWGWLDDTGRIGFTARAGATARSANPVNDGQWHHVVITRNATTGAAVVYVDGVAGAGTNSGAGNTAVGFSSLGRIESPTAPRYLAGSLDDVRYYTTVLTQAEVSAMTARGVPLPPTSLAAAPAGTTAMQLTWSNAASAASIIIERSQDGVTFARAAAVPGSATAHLDTGLEPGRQYYYRIAAANSLGTSTWTTSVSAATAATTAPVAAHDDIVVPEGSSLLTEGSVLANDVDAEGHPLEAQLVTGPANGTLQLLSTGRFIYTPAPGFHGTDTFVYRAWDGAGYSGNAMVTLTVAFVGDAPALQHAAPDQGATQGTPWVYQIPAGAFTDSDGDAVSLEVTLADGSPLPAWITWDGGARRLSGTPANGDVGTLSIRITASDGMHGTAVDAFTLTVANINDPPTLLTPLPEQVTVERAQYVWQVPLSAFQDIDGDTLTFSAALSGGEGLPAWLTFNPATRTFSGTPQNMPGGSWTIRVRATDPAGASAAGLFTLTVQNVNDAPALTSPLGDQSIPGRQAYAWQVPLQAFADSDGEALSFTVETADGSPLPSWLKFDGATGTLSGTPSNLAGTLALRVVARDGSNAAASGTFTLYVVNTGRAPLQTVAIPAFSRSSAGFAPVAFPSSVFVDPDGDALAYALTLSDGTPLPSWLQFDPATLTLSATGPVVPRTYSLRLTATDIDGLSSSGTCSLVVASPPALPVVPPAPDVVTAPSPPPPAVEARRDPPAAPAPVVQAPRDPAIAGSSGGGTGGASGGGAGNTTSGTPSEARTSPSQGENAAQAPPPTAPPAQGTAAAQPPRAPGEAATEQPRQPAQAAAQTPSEQHAASPERPAPARGAAAPEQAAHQTANAQSYAPPQGSSRTEALHIEPGQSRAEIRLGVPDASMAIPVSRLVVTAANPQAQQTIDRGREAAELWQKKLAAGEDIPDVVVEQAMTALITQIDEVAKEAPPTPKEAAVPELVVGSTIVASAASSAGYLLWLVRGGGFLTALLGSLPLWRWFDPLPVVDGQGSKNPRRRNRAAKTEDHDSDEKRVGHLLEARTNGGRQ